MFSLQQFFGRDPKFFDLFEAEAQAACNCVLGLKAVLQAPADPKNLQLVRDARANSKRVSEEIGELVVRTFITVLEREDIEALAAALYKIPKPIEKCAERFVSLHSIFHVAPRFEQVELVASAADGVLKMVRSLRAGINPEVVRNLNTDLQNIETEADKLELELLKELYTHTQNPVEVIAAQDLFDLLEKSIDRCRDVGNVVMHICHKNS